MCNVTQNIVWDFLAVARDKNNQAKKELFHMFLKYYTSKILMYKKVRENMV